MRVGSAEHRGGLVARLSSPSGAGLGLVALVVLFWSVQLLGGRGDKSLDAFEYHYPSYLWLYGELAHGHLPLWNPYQLCGIPTVDTLQVGALYPPHLLYLVLPTDLAMATSGLLHLLWIAATTYVFCLRAGLGPLPALFAALLVATRGAQPGHIINPSMQEAGAWLALGFIGVQELVRDRWLAGGSVIALATGMSLLAGFPQLSLYSAYAWAFVALGLSLGGPRSAPRVARICAMLGVGVALGALMAAVVLWPALELAAIGGRERGTLPLDVMLPFGLAGFETPMRALATALGSRPALPALTWTFGLAGLVLVPAITFAGRLRRLGVVMTALAIASLVFAIGPGTPLFEPLLRLPELGSFRNPWRVLFVADFALAVAAAVGLTALRARVAERSADPRAALRVGAIIAGVALLAVIAESLLAPGNSTRLPYDADHALLAMYHEPRPVLEALAARPDRVYAVLAGDAADMSEKFASVFGVRSIADIEILTLRRQREYFTWLYWGELEPTALNARGHSQRVFYGYYNLLAQGIDPAGLVARSRLLDLAAARSVLVPRSAIARPNMQAFLRGNRLTAVDVQDRQFVVFDQPRALPRVYVSHAVARAPDSPTLLTALAQPDFDPRRLSYIETDDDALPLLGAADARDRVEIVEDGTERVALFARLVEPGLVVLADTYHPGWQVEVDGEPVEILPTNHLFRGVVVPAGEHEIVFRYRPSSVRLGAGLSALGWLVFGGAVVVLMGGRKLAAQR